MAWKEFTTYSHFFLVTVSLDARAVSEKQGCGFRSLKKDLLSDCLSQFSVVCPVFSVSKSTDFLKTQLPGSCNFIRVCFLSVYSKFSWIAQVGRRQEKCEVVTQVNPELKK